MIIFDIATIQKGKKEQGRFSLQVGIETLSFFADYFKIGYPLSKVKSKKEKKKIKITVTISPLHSLCL